jgi:uncharacterized membrane protein YbhN (UPF0104 family)
VLGPSSESNRSRQVLTSLPVRAAVTVLVGTVVALQVDWAAGVDRLAGGDWGWFVAAVAIELVALAIGAWRWHLFLHGAGIEVPRTRSGRAYAVGAFSNNFLPTSFGGDAARAWIVARSGPRLVQAATSVVVDRATSLGCLVAIAWIAIGLDSAPVPNALELALLGITALGAASTGVVWIAVAQGGRLQSRLPPRLAGWGRSAAETVRQYIRSRDLLWKTLVLGLLYQLLVTIAIWFVARSIGLDLPFGLVAVTLPLVLTITALPVSIAGFGLREGGYAVLLAEAGVSTTDAAFLSLLATAALIISTLPGAVALASPGRPDA